MKTPTQDNITAYMQGYQQCRIDGLTILRNPEIRPENIERGFTLGTHAHAMYWRQLALKGGFNPAANRIEANDNSSENIPYWVASVVFSFLMGGFIAAHIITQGLI